MCGKQFDNCLESSTRTHTGPSNCTTRRIFNSKAETQTDVRTPMFTVAYSPQPRGGSDPSVHQPRCSGCHCTTKNGNSDRCRNTAGPWKCHAKWKKANTDTEGPTLCGIPLIPVPRIGKFRERKQNGGSQGLGGGKRRYGSVGKNLFWSWREVSGGSIGHCGHSLHAAEL
jgi:hypothetical protein